MFTGQRLKDCVMLTWDRVDLDRRRIWVKQFKTGREVTIPLAEKLLHVLQEAQAWKRNHFVCPNVAERYNQVDGKGKNTGNNLVNIDVLRVIKWIGLEPSVKAAGRDKRVTVHGFHSLRHSFVSHCAEAGVPEAVVISIVGANSDIVAKHYTHIGEEAQEKAIMAFVGGPSATSDRDRIAKALAIINGAKDKSDLVKEIEQALVS
jgi:integrase